MYYLVNKHRHLNLILNKFNYIIKVNHPSYYARTEQKMPKEVFKKIDNLVYSIYGETIEWYKEFK